MKTRKFWAAFFLTMSILTAIAIFFLSSQPGEDSAELSEGVTEVVAQVVRPDYQQLPPAKKQAFLQSLGLTVRKCAHFSEFALLGLNLTFLFHFRRGKRRLLHTGLTAWGIAALYAGTDELHQMFVDARGPALLDVGIDSGGALTGVLFASLCLALLARKLEALE